MSGTQTTSKSAESRFWERFLDRARKNGVKDSALRWHVLRAEQYLKAFPDKRLAEHSAEDVTDYSEEAGRKGGIADWQFEQVVDAIQTLLRTADAQVAEEVDWMYWHDSARRLGERHPTIAREAAAEHDQPVSGARFKEKRNPPSVLDDVRKNHGPLLDRLVAEIRRRKYSIRTEQAYETWICRFILFCGGHDPREVGEDRIVAFLEDLAVRGQVLLPVPRTKHSMPWCSSTSRYWVESSWSSGILSGRSVPSGCRLSWSVPRSCSYWSSSRAHSI